MKKSIIVTVLIMTLICLSISTFPQVGVNADGSAADPGAMLDVKSTTSGVLIPRLSTTQRDLVPSPATGLLIYNTTANLFNYYNGSQWFQVAATLISPAFGTAAPGGGVAINASTGALPNGSAMLDVNDASRGVLIPRTTSAQIQAPATGLIIYNTENNLFVYYDGTQWKEICAVSTGHPGGAGSQAAAGTAINTSGAEADPSAMLDVSAMNKGILIPRMSDMQRNQVLPVTGLAIFNISSNRLEFFNGTGWCKMNTGCNPWVCGQMISDSRDGRDYPTVQIGDQCWIAKNMNIGSRIDGSSNPENNGIIEKYCYDDIESNCDVYGGLYKWNEVMQYSTTPGVQGICPPGWHVPTDGEFCTLTTYLDAAVTCISAWTGIDAGNKMKEPGTAHWINSGPQVTNSSGFTGLGGGYNLNSYYDFLGNVGHWWTSSSDNNIHPLWMLSAYHATVGRYEHPPDYGFSVRCINDCDQFPSQSDAGPDQLNIQGSSAVLQANTAAAGTGQWSILTGTGGNITDPLNPGTTFSGTVGNSYTLRWTISTSCATNFDEVNISFWGCGQAITDARDNKVYNTLQIGSQCWMKENLNYGTKISNTQNQTNNSVPEKYCYGNDDANCDTYGGLYQWNEMMDYSTQPGSQGLCPAGWHVPADEEWCTMTTFVDNTVDCNAMAWTGTDIGIKLKSATGWYTGNNGNNASGFTALPGGLSYNHNFQALVVNGYFWTSTNAWYRHLIYNFSTIHRYPLDPNYAFSVRCLSDCQMPA